MTGGLGAYYGVEKETSGKIAKTMAHTVGREIPVCRQPLPPVQAGSFNLAVENSPPRDNERFRTLT
jgi:hypothetical protein